ncbi:MAG TPA: DNA methyltransferase [Candidatus Latescibacteria bacterium]|nr:DNA methyltransferase [Candidatus Latescibacterota bacterium]HJN27598.1 DNA methyltransferase [Candidatus Latescibacterota bacterium]
MSPSRSIVLAISTAPEDLIEPSVKATTEKDDLVLDVFAGSGTTGACWGWFGCTMSSESVSICSCNHDRWR